MALATSIAGWVNVVLMVVVLKKRSWLVIDRSVLSQAPRIMLACVLMALALYPMKESAAQYMASGEHVRFAALCIMVMLGALCYFAGVFALNILNMRTMLLLRFKKTPP
jgi:putative peptidoglycan lipid II flippase